MCISIVHRYDDTIFNRFKDPGAGATSYFMGHDFVAKYRDIEANEEVSTCCIHGKMVSFFFAAF